MFHADYNTGRHLTTDNAYMKFRVAQTLDFLTGTGQDGEGHEVIWQPRNARDFADEEYEPARVAERKRQFEQNRGNSSKGMKPKFFDPTGKTATHGRTQQYNQIYLNNQGANSQLSQRAQSNTLAQRPAPTSLRSQSSVRPLRANYDLPAPKPFGLDYHPDQLVRAVNLDDQFWNQHERNYQKMQEQSHYMYEVQQQQQPQEEGKRVSFRDQDSESGEDQIEGAPEYIGNDGPPTLLDYQVAILKGLQDRPVSPPGPGLYRPSEYVNRMAAKSRGSQPQRRTSGPAADPPMYAPQNSMPVHAPPPYYEIKELEMLIPPESIAEQYRRWLIETGRIPAPPPTLTSAQPAPPTAYDTSKPAIVEPHNDEEYLEFIRHEIARERARLEQEARRREQEGIVGNTHVSMAQLTIGIPGSGTPSPRQRSPMRWSPGNQDARNNNASNLKDDVDQSISYSEF